MEVKASRRLRAGGGSCWREMRRHGGHKTAEVRDARRTDEGRGLRGGGGQEKVWVGYIVDDRIAFVINAH